jgi:DNA end-binding protein Ku
MPRPLWTGSLSFGLVNVPVRLVSASRDLDLHFRQLREEDTTPIEVKRFCSEEGTEVPWEEIARQYEFDDGDTVIVTDDELDALAPERTRTIEIDAFVDLEDVDPIYFDHPYLLVPAADNDGALRAYQLLLEVMGRTERAALGRIVLRTKEYLALIRAREERLQLVTMLFHDEVRPTKDVPTPTKKHKPAKHELDQAVALIEAFGCPWDPDRYQDRYEQRLKRIIKRKEKGETIKVPEEEETPSPVGDLMAALEESLARVKDGAAAR